MMRRAASVLPVWSRGNPVHSTLSVTSRKTFNFFSIAPAKAPHMNREHRRLTKAMSLERSGQYAEALTQYRELLKENPRNVQALLGMSALLNAQGFPREAAIYAQEGLRLKPDDAPFHANFGRACFNLGRFDEALFHLAEACRLEPARAAHLYNLGRTLHLLGEHADARGVLEASLQLDPAYPEPAWDLALLDLVEGRFEAGWEGYEGRWQRPESKASLRTWARPAWQGESLQGRRILVHTEQGFGDALMMARYLPRLAQMGAEVQVEAPRNLLGVLGTLDPRPGLVALGEPLPEHDVHVPIMSLPRLFRTRLETIPGEVPYLRVPDQVAHRSELDAQLQDQAGRRKIGLVWCGNPAHAHDRWRSLPFEALAPLLDRTEARFFSLQKGQACPPHPRLTDLGRYLEDFSDTAHALSRLDLVITVDTSVAHLAGALGRPCWTLLAFMSDWRWLWNRNDSPWYPTLRLFRQPRPGDWETVLQGVQAALEDARPAR
jgi:tetratricopeptide (TPR) repeat protein